MGNSCLPGCRWAGDVFDGVFLCCPFFPLDVVGWLFWVLQPFETIFQSISDRLSERGKKRRKDRGE